jgi:hypothetical protein
MVRNAELEKFDVLVGEWTVTISNAWFLEPAGTEVPGTATVEWLGESFLVWRTRFEGDQHAHSEMTWVFGRSDANDRYVALYHDDRGVCREFAMTFDGRHWAMTREDPDMHQRFAGEVQRDQVLARTEASDDQGATWRKDFDLTFVRA